MLMRGGVGARAKPMADYIARDPRTGKPIEVATVVQRAQVEEGRRGAWSRLTPAQVIDLATGKTDVLKLMLDGERRTFTRLDGVEGLVLAKGVHANAAYDALIEALRASCDGCPAPDAGWGLRLGRSGGTGGSDVCMPHGPRWSPDYLITT